MASIYDSLLSQPDTDPQAPGDQGGKAAPSVYDSMLDKQDNEQRAAAGVVLDQVMGKPTDRAARTQELASSTGLPVDVVERNFDQVNRRDQATRLQAAMVDSPVLRLQMTDSQFAALAHDDVERLTGIEKVLAPAVSTLRAIPAGLQKFSSNAVYGLPEILSNAGSEYLGRYLAGTVLPEDPFARVSSGLKDWRKSGLSLGDRIAGEHPTGFVAGSVVSGAESFGRMLPGLLTSIITRNPAFAIGAGALDAGVSSTITGQEKGLSTSQSLAYGLQDAVAEAVTERLPMGRLIGDLNVGAPFWKLLRNQLATEVPTEIAATVWQNFNEWANVNPDKPFSTYLAELPEAEAQTVIATVTATVLTAGMAKGLNRATDRAAVNQAKAEQSEQRAQLLQRLNDLSSASRLATQSPDTFEQYVAQAAENGPVQTVYIDGQALMQSGVAEQVAAASPSVAAQLEVAAATGGQIAIPVEEYAARIAPTEHAQSLLDHLRTDPEGFSRAEAQQYMQGAQEAMQADVERIAQEQQDGAEFTASTDAVRDAIKTQLDAAGRFTSQVNEAYATLAGHWYANTAAKMGITPEAMFQQYPLRVQAEGLTGDQFNQDGTLQTDTPAFKNWFGESKVTDADGQPLVVYHGTDQSFDAFGGEAWFTPVPGDASTYSATQTPGGEHTPNVMPVYLTISKPKTIDTYASRDDIAQAKASGKYDGVIVRGVGGSAINHYVTFSPEGVKSAIGNNGNFDPADPDILHQTARGSFSPSTLTISLLKNADLSTFLHETGHFFLEAQFDMASRPDAPAAIQQDAQALLDWFGVRDLNEWYGLEFEEQRSYHEQFARGFEVYLFEGKSPNIEMHGLFQRFRSWMLSVYKNLKALNVELSDEVRGVFDRMLATDEQIALAEQARSMFPLFETGDQAGMTPEEFVAYQALGEEATNDAQQDLQTRGLRDMQWLRNAQSKAIRQLQKEARSKRAEVSMEARREVMSQPVYRAWQFLVGKETPGGEPVGKISRQSLDEIYGGLTDGKRDKYALFDWKRLTDLRMTANDGLHPDLVAELSGFDSGDAMVRALVQAQPPKAEIEALTDLRMLERHGDLSSPEAIARAADMAIHNEARARMVAAELSALTKATGPRRQVGTDRRGRPLTQAVIPRAARQFAKSLVSRLKIRDLSPGRFASAEARAAKASEKAMRAGELQQAAAEKRNQLVNTYAAKEVYEAQQEVERALRYLKKFDNEGTRKNLDIDYLEQIDTLLARFDLRKGVSLKTLDKRASLAQWIEARNNEGTEPDIPDWIKAEANREHYKNLELEELRGLVDTVRQIEHLGRLKQRLLTAKDKRALDAIVEELRASINQNAGGRVVDNERRNTVSSKVAHAMRGLMAAHRKLANLIREMDGFKDGGPLWEYIVRPMNEAGNKEASMRAEATKALYKLSEPILADGRMGGKGEYFPSIGRSLNRGERIAIALNMGNEGNQQRLQDGRGWSAEQLRPVLSTLTAKEWQFVQGVWDFFEAYRPEIAAKERRVMGKEPNWIEPTPFTVRAADGQDVSMRGGYYPIKYDPNQSGEAGAHADAEQAKAMMRAAYTAATTRRSFTKSRAEAVKGRPLLLSFDGIYQGANEVIHDLAWHEWLIDVNKLLRRIDGPIRTGYGAQTATALKRTVEDIARGDKPATNAVESSLNHLRTGATVAGLGWNLFTALLQPLGITQSMARIGPVWVARGLREFYGNPTQMMAKVDEINEQSPFMANRSRTLSREINEIQNQLAGSKGKMRTMLDASFFVLIQKLQMTVDYPTWLGAYEKAMLDPANALESGDVDTNRVIAMADQAVIDAQGEGQIKDLSQVQRGHPAFKLFTNFYSYFNVAMNLATDATKRTNFKVPVQVARLAGDYMLILVVPALLSGLLRAGFKGDDDDLLKQLAEEQIDYLMGLFVGLREVSTAVKLATGVGNPAFGYSGPAGARFFSEITRLGQQIGQGELDAALLKSANNVSGLLFHYPAGQVQRTVQGVSALVEGRTKNPMSILMGVKR